MNNNFFKLFSCECMAGYTGKNCDVNIDDCSSHDCQNGATCVDGVNAYQCVCATGFTGRLCEIAPVAPVDSNAPSRACHSQKCKNGGICAQQPGSSDQYCRCPPGTWPSMSTTLLVYKLFSVQCAQVWSEVPNMRHWLAACTCLAVLVYFFLNQCYFHKF